MKVTMIKNKKERGSEPGGGLGNPRSRLGRVGSLELGDDIGA